MKKLLRLSIFLMIISIFIFPSNAVTKLYPKATIKLPIKAFESDIAVYNKYIFYNIAYRDLDHYKTYSKSAFNNEKAKQINQVGDPYGVKLPVFKILSDQKLYSIAWVGGGFMGGININQLNKDKSIYMNTYDKGTHEINPFKNKIESFSDPFFMNEGVNGSWYCLFDNDIDKDFYQSNNILKMAPLFSSIAKDYTYAVNYQYNNPGDYDEENQDDDSNTIKAPGIVAIKNTNNKKEMLIPDVQNMVMGDGKIYYYKKEANKGLYSIYSYSLKNKSTELICSNAKFDDNILSKNINYFPVKNNIFFMGDKNYSKLFTVSNKKPKLLYSAMKRVVTNGSIVAVLSQYKNNSEVKILNEKGVEIANITVPNNQSDMFIHKNELIVWSWQDRTVRYYNVPVK
ncbi:hypothetical protein HMPREF0379_1283 [[Eubacterium] yurii subsp. margaretiae ATCC 43715]|nr:hypothetical protein HMPREF0379_1283 [[Eubacterium] yurii subsp. margaretiae ATCC 43715]